LLKDGKIITASIVDILYPLRRAERYGTWKTCRAFAKYAMNAKGLLRGLINSICFYNGTDVAFFML
jgi:hypothetical protein